MGSVVGSDGGESRRRRIRLLRVVREGQERTRGTLESTEGWLLCLNKLLLSIFDKVLACG